MRVKITKRKVIYYVCWTVTGLIMLMLLDPVLGDPIESSYGWGAWFLYTLCFWGVYDSLLKRILNYLTKRGATFVES